MECIIPNVIDKTLKKRRFDGTFIYNSLLKETDITKEDAQHTTKQVIRILIGANLKVITAPLIREVVNTVLLQKGLEIIRLQYTRIGFPFFDLTEKYKEKENSSDEIINHVKNEYENVSKLIKTIQTANRIDLRGLNKK